MFSVPSREEAVGRIILRMLGRNVSLTDWTTISTGRILLEEGIVGVWLEVMHDLTIEQDQWFLNSATGANLDRRLADYGYTRPQGSYATGVIRLTKVGVAGGGITTFSPGVEVRTNEVPYKRFTMDRNPDRSDGRWFEVEEGQEIPVTAKELGPASNAAAGTVTVVQDAAVECTNDLAFTSGEGPASDSETRSDFRRWLQSFTRGPLDAMIYHVKAYEDENGLKPIKGAAMEEWDGDSLLSSGYTGILYIDAGSGTASGAQVTAIQTLVDGSGGTVPLRAAGARIQVQSATPAQISVQAEITYDSAFSSDQVRIATESAIRAYIAGLPIAVTNPVTGKTQGYVNFARLSNAINDVEGVLAARLYSPTTDVPVSVGNKAVPSNVSLVMVAG